MAATAARLAVMSTGRAQRQVTCPRVPANEGNDEGPERALSGLGPLPRQPQMAHRPQSTPAR